ncbi:GNAT family N-acetyltransferase [Oceanobacillus arenosus]|uniref:GNAT family N-acetyltransferase n=1 Tax=Oceanobacillus arenosus TaxID=1229153 RepID=A0A3D8PQ23_9BACI|nr:GNAT family N-acetyltransferase [Oceanobacillus arenosus]RDW17647.1 GNAT family N-acetyltransferase [Oceanobacillus arenosus]
MKKKDIPQVQHIAKTSWNATYEGIIPYNIQENFLNSAYSDKNMKSRLKHSFIFVAEVDKRIVGFANYSPITKDGKTELVAIYLYPEYQGKGIGTAFLRHGIEQLGDVEEIHLNVEKNNEIGMNFYTAKGFEVVSEFEDDFGGHILHTVRMVLRVRESFQK